MKKLLFIAFVIPSLIIFSGCEEENDITFIATPAEGISFTNSFSNEYLLSNETEDNIAERFVWEPADFGAPVNITYDLHASLSADFSEFDVVGSTNKTNLAVTVGTLLDYAFDLGLDDDPTTTNDDGNPNNMGQVFFRLRAYAGAGTGNNTDIISDPVTINLVWLERTFTGGGCASIWVVGAAVPSAGWSWGTPIEFGCEAKVYEAKVRLVNDAFRFFTTKGDWASGYNYPHYEGEGFTIDPLLENANDGDSNFRFIGEPGIYTLTVNENNKTITLTPSTSLWLVGAATPGGWSWNAPTEAKEISLDVWQTTMEFSNNTFRFFQVRDDWGSGLNYPYYVDAGYTISSLFEDGLDGDNNFRFTGTPGTYTVTVNNRARSITMEQ